MSAKQTKKIDEKSKKVRIYLQKDVDNITDKVRKTAKKQLFESEEYQDFLKWRNNKEKYVEQLIFLRKEITFFEDEVEKQKNLFELLEQKTKIMQLLVEENIALEALEFILIQVDRTKPLLEEVKKVIAKHTYLKQKVKLPQQLILNIESVVEV